MSFTIKDSGKRAEFKSGMVRDTTEGKMDFLLIRDGPMFLRWAVHLTNGAIKYAKRNWMKASGPEELDRFRESAARHFEQWLRGDRDEDHAAATFFNINAAEYTRDKLNDLHKTTDNRGTEQFGMGNLDAEGHPTDSEDDRK